ncbi:MAG: phosphoenolpyruvate-protein phosphotransferase [Lysobacteraceae bacterium]|nr:MAG: phosphoenolpyruvate-protein phosphotransferase [Xanthomonadaceae bacterium]
MRRAFPGIVASKGLALGRARVREPHGLDVEEQRIAPDRVEQECRLLHEALEAARAELRELRARIHGAIAHEVGEFLDLHAMLLDDPELVDGLDDLIRTGHYSAAYALRLQRDRLASVFDDLDDPYLRSRREDIDHVIGRVYAALHSGTQPELAGLAGEILVSESIAPAELAQLHEEGVIAVVTAQGSPLSHSAILARSLHLPLVVGSHDALLHVNDGDALLVDAIEGRIIVEPDADDLARFRAAKDEVRREQRALTRLRKAKTRTADGVEVRLWANAESREDVSQALGLGAAGVGLYRTEFLFLQRREVPGEEEQFHAYRDLVLGMDGRPVTIRTLDLGADKADSTGLALEHETNPALGLRGVRLCLARPELFRVQIRAILRASAYGPVRILIPMVSRAGELRDCRRILERCHRELRDEGHALGPPPPLGAMIEVPAAALALDRLLPEADFCSVGTNDLIQYLLAADRGHDTLASLCDPEHPAVVRVLTEISATCRKAGKPVAVCGELAGDPRYTEFLLRLGLTDLSMHPASLLEVRQAVRACTLGGREDEDHEESPGP